MSIAAQLVRGLRLTLVLWLLTVVVITLPMLGLARLVAPDAAPGQLAGQMVGIFGPRIVVGRMGNPEEDPAPGAVSIFVIAPPRIAQEDGSDTSSTRMFVDP